MHYLLTAKISMRWFWRQTTTVFGLCLCQCNVVLRALGGMWLGQVRLQIVLRLMAGAADWRKANTSGLESIRWLIFLCLFCVEQSIKCKRKRTWIKCEAPKNGYIFWGHMSLLSEFFLILFSLGLLNSGCSSAQVKKQAAESPSSIIVSPAFVQMSRSRIAANITNRCLRPL